MILVDITWIKSSAVHALWHGFTCSLIWWRCATETPVQVKLERLSWPARIHQSFLEFQLNVHFSLAKNSTTNNVAEYKALLFGLQRAYEYQLWHIHVFEGQDNIPRYLRRSCRRLLTLSTCWMWRAVWIEIWASFSLHTNCNGVSPLHKIGTNVLIWILSI